MQGEQYVVHNIGAYCRSFHIFDQKSVCPFCNLIRDCIKIKIKLALFYHKFTIFDSII